MPTVITFPDVVSSFNTALDELLRPYFLNGGTFTLGGNPVVFPQAMLVYDAHVLETPSSLTIAFIGDDYSEDERYHCPTQPNGQKPAYEVWASVSRTVYVASPLKGGGTDQNRLLIHKTWAALLAAIECRHSEFAARGIVRPDLPSVPDDSRPRPTIIESSGIFRATLRYKMARHNS